MLEFKLKESLYLGSQLKFRRRVSLRSPKVATSSSSSVVANIRPPKQFLSSKYFSEKGKKVVQRFSKKILISRIEEGERSDSNENHFSFFYTRYEI